MTVMKIIKQLRFILSSNLPSSEWHKAADWYQLEKQAALTTFSRSIFFKHLSLYNKSLTPVLYSKFSLAKSGQGHWLL